MPPITCPLYLCCSSSTQLLFLKIIKLFYLFIFIFFAIFQFNNVNSHPYVTITRILRFFSRVSREFAKHIIGVGSALPSLILIAGTIVILFLLILAGAYDKRPLNEIFFLQADTKGIPNAPQGICHWTLYNVGLSPNFRYSFAKEVMGVQFIVNTKSVLR